MKNEWLKCNRENPCQICKKPDWCTYSADGQVACCMRVQSGTPARNGGWIHRLTEPRPYIPPPKYERPKPPPEDIEAQYWQMSDKTDPEKIAELALRLGVAESALARIGCVYACNCTYAFPMKDQHGHIIGIRYRNDTSKWAELGSKAGLFYEYPAFAGTVIICEGATDAAAALTLGFDSIGRPSCRGQENMLKTLLSRNGGAEFVLCPDKDAPGMEGAAAFAEIVKVPMRLLIPPCKDLREWLRQGATHAEVQEAINNSKWMNLK
jgi:hypothetical protein